MSFVGKIKKFGKEVSAEMKKVTWPTKEQLKESTKVVVVVCIIFALFTFVVDQIVTAGIKVIF
jgi:preprotein translocase subunit SecE